MASNWQFTVTNQLAHRPPLQPSLSSVTGHKHLNDEASTNLGRVILESGLIDYIQKIMVAAIAIADTMV